MSKFNNINIDFEKYDVIIIGCGLSGVVIGERFASQLNRKLLLLIN